MSTHTVSASGVRIASDFRDNLIIDRYDPVFATMRAGKREHLRSENSEDAVTWNVFRSLRQVDPTLWLPPLINAGLPGVRPAESGPVAVDLWRSVAPPPSLVALGAEGDSEIDVIIETPQWVWFIEAKYRSDISQRTTTRALRDQVLRNIDVGSYYAGIRQFFFTLLIQDATRSPGGVEAINRYANLTEPRALLAGHRPDGLSNLGAITLLTWDALGPVLAECAEKAARDDERNYAERALAWMRGKGLLDEGTMNVAAFEALFRRLGFTKFESHKKLQHPNLKVTLYFNRDRSGHVWFAVRTKEVGAFDAALWSRVAPPQKKDRDPNITTLVPVRGKEQEAFATLLNPR